MLFVNDCFRVFIVNLPCSDIAVKHLIGKAEVFLVRYTAEPVNRRFINKSIRKI